MKKAFFFLIFFAILHTSFAQVYKLTSKGLSNDTLIIKEAENDLLVYLKIDLGKDIDILTLYSTVKSGSALVKEDFELQTIDSIRLGKNSNTGIISVLIKADALIELTELGIVEISYKYQEKVQRDTIYIKILDSKEKAATDNIFLNFPYQLTYLNAASFDFGKTRGDINYTGHFNIFNPTMSPKNYWGFNTGFCKINYIQDDDTLSGISNQWFAINKDLHQKLDTGKTIYNQLIETRTTVNNSSLSIYFQPTFRISSENKKALIFLHAHLELLVNTWKTSAAFNIKKEIPIKIDSTYLSTSPVILLPIVTAANSYTYRNAYPYTGLGVTYMTEPWKRARFFIQGTIGITKDNYNKQNPDPRFLQKIYGLSTPFANRSAEPYNTFYLARAYYAHKISDNSQLHLGTDIRGFFNYQPKYAVYLGFNINIDGLTKLLFNEK